jgi:hypothetical protein
MLVVGGQCPNQAFLQAVVPIRPRGLLQWAQAVSTCRPPLRQPYRTGVVCLAYTVPMHLGQRVSVAPISPQRRVQWTVTDRIRWFWCGQRLFTDPGYDWSGWLTQQWESLRQLVTMAPAPPVSETAALSVLEAAA